MDKMETMNQLFLATMDEDQNTTFIGGFFSEGEFSINDNNTITAQDKELLYSPITDNCSACETDFGDKLTIADSLTNITGDITPASQTGGYKLFIIKDRVYFTDGVITAEPKLIRSENKITSSSIAEINTMIADKKAEEERSAKQAEEELRIAAEASAEAARKETERMENERLEEIARLEAVRQAEETARLENEQKARIATAAAEAAALAALKREQEAAALETARIEAERKAKEAEAEKAEADRKAKEAAEQNLAIEQQGEAKRLAEEMAQRQAQEAAAAAEAKRLADAAAEAQSKAEAEKKKADEEKEEAKRKLDETMQKNRENAERRQRAEEEKARRKEEDAARKENARNSDVTQTRGLLKTDQAKGIINSDKASEPLATMPKPDLDRIMTKIKNYDTIISKLEMPIITPAVNTGRNNVKSATRRNGGNGRKINNTKRLMRGGGEDTPKNRFINLCVAFNNLISKILTTPVFFKVNSLTLNNLNTLLDDDTVKIYEKNGTTVTEINKSIIFARIMNFIYFDCSDLETSDDGKKQIFTEIVSQYGPFDGDLLLIENSNASNVCVLFNNEPDLDKKFIHIKKFTSIMMYYVNNYDSVADQRLELENIQNYYSSTIIQLLENIQYIINTVLTIEQSFNTNDFKQKIDDIIQMENSGKIITYVKLTNLDQADKTYNKRFGVFTNTRNVGNSEGRANMLMVKYNDDNFPYYKPENVKELDGRIKKLAKTDKRFDVMGESLTVNNYKSTYLFGKFNKIFNPSLSNEDISRQMDIVKSQALKGRPVFIMGYGASGAGKTSSLIYLNKGDESKRAGILIHLCNIFSAEGYNSLEITSKEFFTTKVDVGNDKCSGGNTEASPMNCITDKFTYSFLNGEFKLASNDVEYKNKHKYRSEADGVDQNPFTQGASLAETMIYLIDTDRFVKATTNNPNSSRSHVLIFVHLTKPGSNPVDLIVGDFAGVENKFQCDNPDVISKFLNIKRDNTNEPYYSTEKEDVKPSNAANKTNQTVQANPAAGRTWYEFGKQTIGNIGSNYYASTGGGKADCVNPEYLKVTDPIFDFKNVVYRESIPKFGNFDNNTQLILLKRMIARLLIRNTGLSDLDTNSVTYNFITKTENMDKVKNNLQTEVEGLISIKINIQEVTRSYVYKLLLGVDETDLEVYKRNMQDRLEKMDQLKSNLQSKSSIYNFRSSRGDREAKLSQSDLLKDFKPSTARDTDNGASSFYTELDSFKTYMKTYENTINTITDLIVAGNSSKQSFYFYTDDPNHETIPIKRKYELKDIVKSLLENGEFFGKISQLMVFAGIKTENNIAVISQTAASEKMKELLDKSVQIYNAIYEIIEETNCRSSYGTQICENRVFEGNFINSSLSDIRDTIKEIMIEKNKDVLYNSPEYINECLETYCPTRENCFDLNNSADDKNKIPSVIFEEIMKQLKEGGKTYNTKYEFYNKIVVCVFCVFNISRRANNPPPTPYMDINRMKQLLYYENIDKSVNRAQFISEFNNLIKKIKEDFSDKLGNILESNEYEEMNELMKILSSISRDRKLDKPQIDTVQNFISMIDKSNAVSAIGTLEFVDQMAKFNTVNTVCSTNSPYLKDASKLIASYNLKDVVE